MGALECEVRVGAGGGVELPQHWIGLDDMRTALRRYLEHRCRDRNEAEDIVQETLLRAARYRRSQLGRRLLRPWLLRIAANVWRDHARRTQRCPAVGLEEEHLEQLVCPGPVPGAGGSETIDVGGELVDKDDAVRLLSGALSELVDHDRAVLRSYYGGRQNTGETAEECGIPPSLVKVRLFRARRRLERAILAQAAEARARRFVVLA